MKTFALQLAAWWLNFTCPDSMRRWRVSRGRLLYCDLTSGRCWDATKAPLTEVTDG